VVEEDQQPARGAGRVTDEDPEVQAGVGEARLSGVPVGV
jgi:hypothetical protein